jgi:hypothetical protein
VAQGFEVDCLHRVVHCHVRNHRIGYIIMTDQPIAWGMPQPDGAIIDCITPEEHARMPGQYTVPLYAAPQPKAEPQEPVALDHIACICDGELRYMSGRCAPAHDCELYAMPDGKAAPVLYTAPQTKAEQKPAIYPDEAFDLGLEAIPYYAAPQPRKRLDVHEILDLMPEGVPARYDGELIAFCRAIEAAVWGEKTWEYASDWCRPAMGGVWKLRLHGGCLGVGSNRFTATTPSSLHWPTPDDLSAQRLWRSNEIMGYGVDYQAWRKRLENTITAIKERLNLTKGS